MVVGRAFGEQMEQLFASDLAHAREIDAEGWSRRPLAARLGDRLSRLLTRWI